MTNIEIKLDGWKKRLLDLSKKNRLINFRETKRSNLNIVGASFEEIYQRLVVNEEKFVFPYEIENYDNNESMATKKTIIPGDIETEITVKEQQLTLKSLRDKAKTAMEEQGVNILYLSFGFLQWKESENSSQTYMSPIVLVPASITVESIRDPYVLSLHEDEIVVNPTLLFKLENDFGIKLPEFDSSNDNLKNYLDTVNELVKRSGWSIVFKVSLSLLSFLKINMYHDLNKHKDKLENNPFVKALCGDYSEIKNVPEELNNFDHDAKERPIDVFQVMDADSSQLDAISLSKRDISFVLQGPPGTGKSQTITNIIAEALADGKKVLFVSEKMAALEVVYRRLTSASLEDFCLILHSHKANKKEVLKSLEETIRLNKVSIRDDALHQLTVLENEREKLNQYSQQLHTRIEPLGKTIFEVNGNLAKLTHAPELVFAIPEITNISGEKFRSSKYLLEKFANTIEKMKDEYDSNCWKGCIVEQVTHELRHDIETYLKKILPHIHSLGEYVERKFNEFSIANRVTYKTIPEYIMLFDLCSQSRKIPEKWLTDDDINELTGQAVSFEKLKNEYFILREELLQSYQDSIVELEGEDIQNKLEEIFTEIKRPFFNINTRQEQSIFEQAALLTQLLSETQNALKKMDDISSSIADMVDISVLKTIREVTALAQFGAVFSEKIRPSGTWFEQDFETRRVDWYKKGKQNQEKLANLRNETLLQYEKEIWNIDYIKILERFKTEYHSFFKFFKGSYKDDCKTIRGLRNIPVKKMPDNEIIDLLGKIKQVKELEQWYQDNDLDLKKYLGGFYNGENTNYDEIEKAFDCFDQILLFYNGRISEKAKAQLIQRSNENLLKNQSMAINQIISSVTITDYASLCADETNIFDVRFQTIFSENNTILQAFEDLINQMKPLVELQRKEMNYTFHKANIKNLVRLQDIKINIERQESELKKQFAFMYHGLNTDWDEILKALQWTGKIRKAIDEFALSEVFKKRMITEDDFTETMLEVLQYIKSIYEETNEQIKWFDGLFDIENLSSDLNLFVLDEKVRSCLGNLFDLEDWVDFRLAREACQKNGLSEFTDLVLKEKIEKTLIINAYEKRFYRLWLDGVLPQFPEVYHFRRRNHHETIQRFAELDRIQFKIASSRIREKLISCLPDLDGATSAADEVGILRKELNKQRKIMPIRKLFARIPSLLPSLKPCLMMSPLSVSLFLQSESYQFDMIIFDEASQVCTENAIGAIMRGKQIIIAGDSEQLPPTNFFNATISDSDYDSDDDDFDESDAYQSVLDEAITVLPDRPLKWHYRSRHEHLIAFSNTKIYNNSLITFPANIGKIPDHGVEYIYVKDGVYDRGGNQNNVNEANRIALVVFENFDSYPSRSIGVITFSMKQQQAVDAAIRQMRLQRPQYESFFNEDREEPFFIKNLENVQGDERDTIIFSIGYAKDVNGVMYMNFGPLSRSGGYRRLNVAITRAKHNIKLVGSIHPTDINLEKTSADGVKMLRSYIEFAINGMTALDNELKYDKVVNTESPFEESVYDYLISNGCGVTTQVGCSGYRIDMAVNHPTLASRFVLGIECDGATYHSSRTARERDRLRQAVLENIGWKIYRIWSTDWIKDPSTEGLKLLEIVEQSISEYTESMPEKLSDEEDITVNSLNELSYLIEKELVVESVGSIQKNGFGFKRYEEANIYEVERDVDDLQYVCSVINHIVTKEYPIHSELLCKRVAPIFGNQKATNKVRDYVKYAIDHMKEQLIQKEDFFYPISYQVIFPRVPAAEGPVRTILHISTDELSTAMLTILSNSYGMPKENLYQITSREYGFNRMGSNIVAAFNRTIALLKENNAVKEVEGKILLV